MFCLLIDSNQNACMKTIPKLTSMANICLVVGLTMNSSLGMSVIGKLQNGMSLATEGVNFPSFWLLILRLFNTLL